MLLPLFGARVPNEVYLFGRTWAPTAAGSK
jgi:hypothetical protein